MLIYDRRRCRPIPAAELRRRLTWAQRAKLMWLEHLGWDLLFVRGMPATVFLASPAGEHAMIARDGRVVSVRHLPQRPSDRPLPQADAGNAAAA